MRDVQFVGLARFRTCVCPMCEGSTDIDCECCHGDIEIYPCDGCNSLGTLTCPLCVGEGTVSYDTARGYLDAVEAGKVKA